MTGCQNKGANGAVPNSTWGPAVWGAMHALAYASECDEQSQGRWKHFLKSINQLIPCHECREHFSKELKQRDSEGWVILDSPQSLQRWLWGFHHEVTARIMEPTEGPERQVILEKLKHSLDEETVRKRYMTSTNSCGLGMKVVVTGGGVQCLPTPEAFEYSIVIGMLCIIVIVALLLHRCEVRCGSK